MEKNKNIFNREDITSIINYIHELRSQSFAGWTVDEHKGYETACISIEKFIDENL